MNGDAEPVLTARMVPSLLARDMHETRAFYERLGFRLTGCDPDRDDPSWMALTRDAVSLWFYRDPPRGTPATPQMSGTIYLWPTSVMALAQAWQDIVPFAWGPEVMWYGAREFAIRDPSGYHIAFTEPANP